MLRWSSASIDQPVDLGSVTDSSVDSRVPAGRALIDFATALVERSGVEAARDVLLAEVGAEATAMAATVCANFEMMNRILDATGVPAPRRPSEITEDLGIDPETFGKGV